MAKEKTDELSAANKVTNSIISGLKVLREDFAAADKEYLDGAESLYNLVGQIYDFYRQVIADKDSIKRFNEEFNKLKEELGGKDDAGIERKVLRIATNGIKRMTENRYKTYARVLKAAYEVKIHDHIASGGFKSFADWVKQMGGFEGITRATEPKDANNAAEALEQAKQFYADPDRTGAVKATNAKNIPSVPVEDRHKHTEFKVLLVRDADNSIVDSTVASSVVNNAIKHLAKKRQAEVNKWMEKQSISTNYTITRRNGEQVSAEEAQAELEAA